MKFLVLSDSHRILTSAFAVLDKVGKSVDGVIHLGDTVKDAESLMQKYPVLTFYIVRGNCDPSYSGVRDSRVFMLNGKRIFITHGDKYNVKWGLDRLMYATLEKEADAVLFGHTHVPYSEYYESVLFMNPGSISEPRMTNNPTYAILDITDDKAVTGSVIEVIDKDTFVPLNKFPKLY